MQSTNPGRVRRGRALAGFSRVFTTAIPFFANRPYGLLVGAVKGSLAAQPAFRPRHGEFVRNTVFRQVKRLTLWRQKIIL